MNFIKKTTIVLTAMQVLGPPSDARADIVGPISRAVSRAFTKFMTASESKAGRLASEESAFERIFLIGAIRFTAPRGEKILEMIRNTHPMDTTIGKSELNLLPDSVDLRPWDNPIQNQHHEGMCTAFAIAAVLESRIAITTGTRMKLSERQIWSFYKTPDVTRALPSLSNQPIVTEDVWPFDMTRPLKKVSQKSARFNTSSPANRPERVDVDDPDDRAGHAIDTVNIHNTLTLLAHGKALFLATETTEAFVSPKLNRGARRGHIGAGAVDPHGGHAMTIVGYKKDNTIAGGGYFIVRNSWGENWGDRGYGYLPFDHCRVHLCAAWALENVRVDNEPITLAGPK